MRSTRNAPAFLIGVIMIPIGIFLYGPIGGRVARQEYRNHEDLYTLLLLLGGVIILAGIVLVVLSIFRSLRKIDRLPNDASLPSPDRDISVPTVR
jgi:O-antigen/teichoic acid export membrane protein